MIQRGFLQCAVLRCQEGEVAEGKRRELKAQELIVEIEGGLRVKRDPLGSKGRIPCEVTETENIVNGERIDTHPVDEPGIAEVDILPELQVRPGKERTVITGSDQH